MPATTSSLLLKSAANHRMNHKHTLNFLIDSWLIAVLEHKYKHPQSWAVTAKQANEENAIRITPIAQIHAPAQVDVAFVFNGIVRSLNYTIENLHRQIFSVLDAHQMTYHKYMHSFVLLNGSKYSNQRNHQHNVHLDPNMYKLLDIPDEFVEIEDQNVVKQNLDPPVEAYRSRPDAWKNGYSSLDNFILAMYSRHKVINKLIEKVNTKQVEYKYVVFLRSDVLFKTPLDIEWFGKVTDDDQMLIADFHHWGGYNDRFGICSQQMGMKFGLEYEHLYNYSLTHKAHSEDFKKFMLDEVLQRSIFSLPE